MPAAPQICQSAFQISGVDATSRGGEMLVESGAGTVPGERIAQAEMAGVFERLIIPRPQQSSEICAGPRDAGRRRDADVRLFSGDIDFWPATFLWTRPKRSPHRLAKSPSTMRLNARAASSRCQVWRPSMPARRRSRLRGPTKRLILLARHCYRSTKNRFGNCF